MPGSVPYLLGIEALRAQKAHIDLCDSTIELLGNKIRGKNNKSGHITVSFETQLVEDKCNVVIAITEHNKNFEQETAFIEKIHKKFAHAKSFKIQRLLESSSMFKEMPKTKLHMFVEKTVKYARMNLNETEDLRIPL